MRPTFSARIDQANAALLVFASGAAALAAAVFIAARAEALGPVLLWCRDFVLASVTGASWLDAAAAGVVAIAGIRAGWFALMEAARGLRFRRQVIAQAISAPARVSAAAARVRARRTAVVSDASPFACTVGLFVPTIVLSSALISRLSRREIEAVVRHEYAHARRRDPLRAVLWELFRRACFFFPVMKDVAAHRALRREIAADAAANVGADARRALASALLKTSVSRGFSCAFAGMSGKGERARALLGERRVLLRVDLRRFLVSAAVAGSMLLSGSSSVRAAEPRVPRACPSGSQEQMSLVNFSPYLKFEVRDGPMSSAVQTPSLRP